MLRRPPLKTYKNKHTAQTSLNFLQTPLEAVRLNKKVLSTGEKNKPTSVQDDKDYRDLSLSYLETTFDRLAKDVKLPTPPPQDSHSSINLSSDVSTHPMSSPKTNTCSVNFEESSAVTGSNNKPKRRPVRPHLAYKDSDVIIKQRTKYDSLNSSTKKCKAIRTSKRKASAKISKNAKNTGSKQVSHIAAATQNNSKDWFATKPTMRHKILKDHKQGSPNILVKRKRVKKISISSLSEGEGSHLRVSANKTEIKSQETFESNAVEEKFVEVQVANHIDTMSSNQANLLKSKIAENEQTKSLEMKPCIGKITINDMEKCTNQKQHHNPRHSLFALKCSTPINTYTKIDRSINRLSPITVSNRTRSNEQSIVENVNGSDRDKVYLDENQPRLSLENIRKRISISYEEDISMVMSDECCQENIVDKTARENLPNQKSGKCVAIWEQMSSPTSQIQESLDILKLSANVPNEKNSADNENESNLLTIADARTDDNKSIMIYENIRKHEETNEYTDKSRNAHSQLTPTGIITTRSGRQLMLATTKYLHNSHGSNNKSYPDTLKIDNEEHSAPDYEMIDNSQIKRDGALKYQNSREVATQRTVSKAISKDKTTKKIIELNATDVSTVDQSATDQIRSETESRDKGNTSDTCDLFNTKSEYDITSTGEMTQSMIQSTGNSNISTISSHFDATPKDNSKSSSSLARYANASDPDWITLSSNESSNYTKMECPSASIDSCDNHTERISGSSSKSNIRETLEDTSYAKNEIINESVSSRENSVSKVDNQWSPKSSEVPLNQRMNLLLDKITIRKRRKTFTKPETELAPEVVEEQTAIQTSGDTEFLNQFYDDSRSTSRSSAADGKRNRKFMSEKSIDHYLAEKSSNTDLKMNLQPVVLLERLKDPAKCSVKEKKDCRSEMNVIHEISHENSPTTITDSAPSKKSYTSEYCQPQDADQYAECSEKCDFLTERFRTVGSRCRKTVTFANDNDCSISKMDASELEIVGRQSLFLKPGKKWARSLSILNYIQNGLNLEELSSGKGKNWRKSVQTILDMQQNGVFQSCLRENEGDKSMCFDAPNRTSIRNATTPLEEVEGIVSASPGKFIPRISIRVVPDNKRVSQTGDTSFLEAYGISASKSTRTLSERPSFKPTRKTLVSHVQCEDVSVDTVETEDIITARDVVLQRCHQEDYISFDACFPPEYLARCRKIGEGVYGEVFLHDNGKQKSVIKIIPIEGNEIVNGERQKRFDEILSEIVIAKELHNLRNGVEYQTDGFVEVKKISCISGKYPEKLIQLWKAYDDDKGSDNDCPSLFGENQLYIALELGHGGQDLEAFVFQSAVESHALFIQAALALAVAEQSLEFEHRDLHWGNVLISRTKNSRATYKLDNKEYSYPTKGMQVAIIDFTLSRMSYEGCCIFNDLALDPALFIAQGEYQFEVYRLMRDKIGNDWQKFEPYTNVLWLHYTLDKMITALRYKKKTTKEHKEAISRLEELKEVILSYRSAFDFVTNCENITGLQCKGLPRRKVNRLE